MNTLATMADAEAYLAQYLSSKGSYTLERMQKMMDALGNPEKKLRVIHIGGTAGKGSTAYIAATILEKSGFTVGLHTSPHMISVTERIMINRVPISENAFVRLLQRLMPIIETFTPTYYEITVVMMFTYFAQEHVDVAIVEVGLGGRLDGTNVLTPLVSVVNNVGLDHTEILGDTIEKIAEDKREIIKIGHPVVSGATQETVRTLIIEKAAAVDAPLSLINRDFFVKNLITRPYPQYPPIQFDYVSEKGTMEKIHLSLLGRHQAINAAVAITAVRQSGLDVSEKVIREALSSLSYIGRFEITTIGQTQTLIDGAHNPMKMAALAQALSDHFPKKTFPTLIAVKRDKNVEEMVQLLAPHVSHWYVTTLERQTDWGNRMMYATEDLAKIISRVDPGKALTIEPDYKAFLSHIPEEKLLVTGSLYLVGAVEEFMASK